MTAVNRRRTCAYRAGRGRRLCRRNNSVRRTPAVRLQTPSAASCGGRPPPCPRTPRTAARLQHAHQHARYTPTRTTGNHGRYGEPMALTWLLTPDCVDDVSVLPAARVLWSEAGPDQLGAAAHCSQTQTADAARENEATGGRRIGVRTWRSIDASQDGESSRHQSQTQVAAPGSHDT